jgi:transposase
MRVAIRRIRCKTCNASHQEPISFCPDPYVRYTKWAARFAFALRGDMSIKAVAKRTGLHWDTVKNIEKEWLERKCERVRLNDVKYLGIDEVYLGKKLGFITVVRDLDSGAVLHIGKGKGRGALVKFRKRIKKKAKQIKAVAMDMANSYSAWVAEVLPDATSSTTISTSLNS